MADPSAPEAGELVPYGYAPGSYYVTCGECKEKFIGDKRAARCRACAAMRKLAETEKRLAEAQEALRVIATQSVYEDDEYRYQLQDMIDAAREVAEDALRSAATSGKGE